MYDFLYESLNPLKAGQNSDDGESDDGEETSFEEGLNPLKAGQNSDLGMPTQPRLLDLSPS